MRLCRIAGFVFCAAMLCAASAACAHDADTVAFYSFANLATGSSVTNGLVNEIDAATFPGRFEVGGAGDVVVSDDAPGDYVFSTLGHLTTNDAVCVKPKSIYFGGTGADACKLLFDGMSTYLSSNAAYTIEFFYKLADDAVAGGTTAPFVVWRGNWLSGKKTDVQYQIDSIRLCLRNITSVNNALYMEGRTDGDSAVHGNANVSYPAGTCLRDGKWHHIALSWPYKVSSNISSINFTLERRFSEGGARLAYIWANGVLDESQPVTFNYSGNFKGWISCIRISKINRFNNDFLSASRLPTCVPQTAAYYRLEGEPGSDVAAPVTNSAPTYADFNPQLHVWATAYEAKGSETLTRLTGRLTGEGSLMAPVAGASLKYSADVKRERVVADNVEAFNTSSIRMVPAEAHDGDGWQLAQGLVVSNSVFAMFKGEYTFEMFFKFDKDLWMERIGSKALSPATSNLATLAWMSYGGTSRINSWNLSIDMTQPDSPALIWQSDSHPTTMGDRWLAPKVTDGNWHHIAAQRYFYAAPDTHRMRLYLDGEILGSRDYSYYQTDAFAVNRQFYIGAPYRAAVSSAAGYQSHAFAGELDEIRITARALDPSEFLRQRSAGVKIIIW